jgi:hypothetical protein
LEIDVDPETPTSALKRDGASLTVVGTLLFI